MGGLLGVNLRSFQMVCQTGTLGVTFKGKGHPPATCSSYGCSDALSPCLGIPFSTVGMLVLGDSELAESLTESEGSIGLLTTDSEDSDCNSEEADTTNTKALRVSPNDPKGLLRIPAAWAAEIPGRKWPDDFKERGSEIQETEHRAIQLQQMNVLAGFVRMVLGSCEILDENPYSAMRGERVMYHNVNMYHMCDHFIKPLTDRFKCSFVDLVAQSSQPPLWFVSHGKISLISHSYISFLSFCRQPGQPSSTRQSRC